MKTRDMIYGFALALTCGLAGTLKAQNLYVANGGGTTIGEYGPDGSVINASVISGSYVLNAPGGIAISRNNVFVANSGTDNIGEYTTSGATINASLISGLNFPIGIAISGNNLFVVNEGLSSGNGT